MPAHKGPKLYRTSLEAFLEKANYLDQDGSDAAFIVAARSCAKELDDKGPYPPLLAQYRQILQRLEAKAPKGDGDPVDEFQELLDRRNR